MARGAARFRVPRGPLPAVLSSVDAPWALFRMKTCEARLGPARPGRARMSSSLARAALRSLSPEIRGRAQPLGDPGPSPGFPEPAVCGCRASPSPLLPRTPRAASPGRRPAGALLPLPCGLSLLILLTSF